MRFDELDLEDEVLDGIDAMNFQEMTPVQEQTIPIILDGRDIIACAQTGTGKTAAYTLPLLNRLLLEGNEKNVVKSVAHIDGPEVQKGKVNVTLTVKRTSRAFELSFQTDGMVWVPCDRCLDDMELPISSSDKLMVKFGHEYAEEGDNLIVIPEEEGEINVAWFMYEFVALSIPMKHVHAPGKCNKAVTSKLNKHLKTNANEDSDDTFDTGGDDIVIEEEVEEQIDPRWNELKKILDNN